MDFTCSAEDCLKLIEELIPVHANVFSLDKEHYGCEGKVLSHENGDVNVNLILRREFKLDKEKYLAASCKYAYMPAKVAATGKQFTFLTFSKITGSLFLIDQSGKKYDVGLHLKSTQKNEEKIGYVKRVGSLWLYSDKTVELVDRYRAEFPQLFLYINSFDKEDYSLESIYPESGLQKVKEIQSWLYKQEHSLISPVVCGSELLPSNVVAELERDLLNVQLDCCKIDIKISPEKLYCVNSSAGNFPPVAQRHFLMDRVISCRKSCMVPLGYRGFIIGIYKNHKRSQDLFIILFDKPFFGAVSLLGSKVSRFYVLFDDSFINISDGIRCYEEGQGPTGSLRPHRENKELAVVTRGLRVERKKETFVSLLLSSYQKKGMGRPEYHLRPIDNSLVMAEVTLPDGITYYGSPCTTKEEACETVALKACVSICLVESELREDQNIPYAQPRFLRNFNHGVPEFSPQNLQSASTPQAYPPSYAHFEPSAQSGRHIGVPINRVCTFPPLMKRSTPLHGSPLFSEYRMNRPTFAANQFSWQQVPDENSTEATPSSHLQTIYKIP